MPTQGIHATTHNICPKSLSGSGGPSAHDRRRRFAGAPFGKSTQARALFPGSAGYESPRAESFPDAFLSRFEWGTWKITSGSVDKKYRLSASRSFATFLKGALKFLHVLKGNLAVE